MIGYVYKVVGITGMFESAVSRYSGLLLFVETDIY